MKRISWLKGLIIVAAAACGAWLLACQDKTPKPSPPDGDKPLEGERWLATIEIPMRTTEVIITFAKGSDGKHKATLDVPAQKVKGIPLAHVVYTDKQIKFTLEKPKAPKEIWEHYDAKRDGNKATGTMTIRGQPFPLKMKRLSTGEKYKPQADRRPQTPKPPFPYSERELSFKSEADGTKLTGTLTIPKGEGKHPAVVLISGSGAQDRNCDLLGHKFFLVIADHLTRKGIAVLRFDDRGVGGSGGKNNDASMDDKAGDALGAIAELAKQAEIDPKKIGLLGHSEGGIVAPIAAAKSKAVHFVIMLAGTGTPGDQVMYRQKELVLRAGGAPEELIKKLLVWQRKLLDAVVADTDEPALRKLIDQMVDFEVGLSGPDAKKKLSADMRKNLIETAFLMVASKSGRSFIRSKPAETLAKVSQPVLALWGELDTQVAPDENLAAAKKALEAGGNKDFSVKKMPKLNHAFQHAKTGLPTEYQTIEETISPEVLEMVSTFVTKKTAD